MPTTTCTCPGDTNGDGLRNGADIGPLVDCLMSGDSCQCADVDGVDGVTLDDINAFVADLLGDNACP